MEKHYINHAEFADLLGVSKSTLSRRAKEIDFIYSNNVMFKPNPNRANDYVVENMVERNFTTSSASGVAIVTEKLTHFTSFQYTGN